MDSVTIKALRRAWVHSHGLGGRTDSARSALAGAGWLHAIAGVDPYLSVRSRYSALAKAELDGLLADDTVRIVSAARGCTMLVADDECGLALSLSLLVGGRSHERDLMRLDVSIGEIERAASGVIELLMDSPLTSRDIRKRLPVGLVRSLGEAGSKVGYSSTLPMVMRWLEYQGRVGRWPEGDRLDNQRYRWDLLDSDLEIIKDSELVVRLSIEHYLKFAGASSVSDFSAWSGVGIRQSEIGFESLGLHPFRVEGTDTIVYADKHSAELLLSGVARVPKSIILPFREPLVDHRDGLALLLDPKHYHLQGRGWGSGTKSLVEVRRLGLRTILIDGSVGGFWEYDEESQEIYYALFDQMRGGDLRGLEADLEELAGWLFSSFGHAKIHQTDSIRARRTRVDSVLSLREILKK